MKTYIAVRTRRNQYKFINIAKLKEDAGNVACVVMIFAVVYLMMFI